MNYLKTRSGYIPPAPACLAYFPSRPFDVPKYEVLRSAALVLSPSARLRLEWMIFYKTVGEEDVTATAKYFNISRKTFHKWYKLFKASHSLVSSLESRSKRPKSCRKWEVTATEEERIKILRQQHLKYGKRKLKKLYENEYHEVISTWKIERVIRAYNLYPNKAEHARKLKLARRRQCSHKVLIKDFKVENILGFLWHFDTIEIWWEGQKYFIFTALEDLTKIAYARIYGSKVSKNGSDFLTRLRYLANDQVLNSHQDNGSEFEAKFREACAFLKIPQIFSRPHTPKDNPCLERFNRTIQEEWLEMSEVGLNDITEANHDLTEWLVEYNFKRPHDSLDLSSPIVYANEHYKVSPMWSACTRACFFDYLAYNT